MANSDDTSILDTSGDTPRLDLAALTTSALGAILWGWYTGVGRIIDGAGDAILGSIGDFESWFSVTISTMFNGFVAAIDSAAASNVAFLFDLGALGVVVGLIEGMAIMWGTLLAVQLVLDQFGGSS